MPIWGPNVSGSPPYFEIGSLDGITICYFSYPILPAKPLVVVCFYRFVPLYLTLIWVLGIRTSAFNLCRKGSTMLWVFFPVAMTNNLIKSHLRGEGVMQKNLCYRHPFRCYSACHHFSLLSLVQLASSSSSQSINKRNQGRNLKANLSALQNLWPRNPQHIQRSRARIKKNVARWLARVLLQWTGYTISNPTCWSEVGNS